MNTIIHDILPDPIYAVVHNILYDLYGIVPHTPAHERMSHTTDLSGRGISPAARNSSGPYSAGGQVRQNTCAHRADPAVLCGVTWKS